MGKILGGYLMPHPPIIIPDIGMGREREIQNTIEAMYTIAKDIEDKKPDTIIVISPHGTLFRDAISIMGIPTLEGSFKQFRASDIVIKKDCDLELAKEIDIVAWAEGVPTVLLDDEKIRDYKANRELDHGLLVPLYFIEQMYKQYQLVHINYGLLSKEELYTFGEVISQCVQKCNKNVVVIASGDLSHKLSHEAPAGYNEMGKIFDTQLIKLLSNNDVESIFALDETLAKEAGECGLRSIFILLGVFDGFDISTNVLSYEGPFGVGYGTAIIHKGDENTHRKLRDNISKLLKEKMQTIRKNEDEYIKLARKALETFILHGEKITFSTGDNPELSNNKAGVFVSIKKEGELRGCIGTIEAVEKNVGEEIIRNAIHAGTEDPRFLPVEKDELEALVYSVDVLSLPEEIDSEIQLDVKKYGVIVEKDMRRGLLLPNLEGIDTTNEQVDIALSKANIRKGEKYKMYRFKVERHR